MPKQKGPLKIVGSLEDINFYKLKKGYAVRMKGGVDKDRILNEAKFARTRENMSEFGHCATCGKYLRKAGAEMTLTAKDSSLVPRMTKAMTEIKNRDATSPRGQRRVEIGIQTPDGLRSLKGFDFNGDAPVHTILNAPYTVSTATGEIAIPNLIPAKNLQYPAAASHVSLMAAFLNIDFATGDFDAIESPITNLPLNMVATPVTLTPAGTPSGSGISLYFLAIQFFQEINGIQYPLTEGEFNSLSILETAS